jgi:hypothetical protein
MLCPWRRDLRLSRNVGNQLQVKAGEYSSRAKNSILGRSSRRALYGHKISKVILKQALQVLLPSLNKLTVTLLVKQRRVPTVKSEVKDFRLSPCYWIVQQLFNAYHYNTHHPVHSDSISGASGYVTHVLIIRSQIILTYSMEQSPSWEANQ